MTRQRRFAQVDGFGSAAYRGNPVAVVVDGEDIPEEDLRRFAVWTNLSETTFLLPPTEEAAARGADYRVRIFTPGEELPFAGHPTLGSCHAWLEAGGRPAHEDVVVQECGIGLVELRRDGGRLAFAAPPLLRSGPLEPEVREAAAAGLGLRPGDVLDAAWVDNGPGWMGLLLRDAEAVLAVRPRPDLARVGNVGIIGPHGDGGPAAYEVRGFFLVGEEVREDPVTGSLNASLAQWLTGSGRAQAPYVARQGTAIDRDGRIHVDRDEDGTIWVGGATATCVRGEVAL